MGFENVLLLAGAGLVAVPILIHLLSRRWYQRRAWAAMEFLLRAVRKHRRRLQFENLLLLLIRALVVLLLAFAVARPFLLSTAFGPVAADREESWIFALDTSWSMGLQSGPRTLFEDARETISDMISSRVKKGDWVAIVTMDADPHVVLEPTQVPDSDRGGLLMGLGEVTLTPRPVDLARSLETVRDVAARFLHGPAARVLLFSDFQRRDWLSEGGPRDPAVLALITQTQDAGAFFSLADLKGSDRNLSLLELEVSPRVISRDVWVQLRASVRNWGHEDFDRVELTFTVDGQEEAGSILRVPAGETAVSPPVPFRFPEAGYHAVTAEIRSDGLALDNRRFLAVRVREEASVLLVDGEAAGDPLDRPTLHLEAALSPDPGAARRPAEGKALPYRPVRIGVDELADASPRDHALVVLADVGYLPDRFLAELKGYVRDGGGLIVFLGKNVDPAWYAQALGGDAGLLPARIGRVQGDARASFHLVPADAGHPLVRYFESHRDVTSLFEPMVEFRQFYRCTVLSPLAPPEGTVAPSPTSVLAPPEGTAAPAPAGAPPAAPPAAPAPPAARVAFRFSDPDSSPAIFDIACGQGRAMWIASTADRKWNDFPVWPDFVAFLYEAIPYLVSSGEARINLPVGEPFRQVFDAAGYAQSCQLVAPGSTAPVSKVMTKLEGESRFVITHEETWTPGIYELRLSRPGAAGREAREYFAVNIDPREGDLRPLLPDDLRDRFPGFKASFFDADRDVRDARRQSALKQKTELWSGLLWAALALLLTETALAQFLGRRAR